MIWNWQQPSWPNFEYAAHDLTPLEAEFQRRAGE
ncbi:DUF4172 domain-containing protein, partial [bacterium]